jgi:hypothetical protein
VAPERLTVLAFARHRAFWRQSVEFRVTDVRLMFAIALLFSSGCRPHARPSAPASPRLATEARLLSDSAATTLRQLQQDEQGSARMKALTAVSDLQHFAAQTAELADAAERGADLTTLRSKVGHLERDVTLLDKSLGEAQPSPVVRDSWERTRAAFTRLLADLR